MFTHRKLLATSMVLSLCASPLLGDQSDRRRASLGDAEFEQLHRLVKPRSGESRWMEIDWHSSVWEARRQAAAEGKPIFLMAGSGGAPVAGC